MGDDELNRAKNAHDFDQDVVGSRFGRLLLPYRSDDAATFTILGGSLDSGLGWATVIRYRGCTGIAHSAISTQEG